MNFSTLTFILCFSTLSTLGTLGADLQSHTQTFTPLIQQQVLMVGRLGLTETRPAVALGEKGPLLAPKITSVDGTETPYILYHRNGTRETLEILAEPKQRPVVLLKRPAGLEVAQTDLADPETIAKSQWFYHPTLSPSPVIGEPAAIVLDSKYPLEKEENNIFAVKIGSLKAGSPILDLQGHLVAITLPSRTQDKGKFSRALLFSRLVEDLEELQKIEPSPKAPPHFPTPQAPPLHPAVGLIINDTKQITYSVGGTIIREDGLILTKASELGPELTFQFQDQEYPAVLLATDSATDLAIVGVTGRKFPVITWSDHTTLKPGTLFHHRSLLSQNAPEMEEMNDTHFGTFNTKLPEHPMTIHHASRITSLGLVPEQLQNDLIISAIRAESPASKTGLRLGDRILKLNDQTISNRPSLLRFLEKKEVAQEVKLTVSRQDETLSFTLPLTSASLTPETTGITLNEPQTCVPSVVRGPFPLTIAHTLSLNSWDCGAPLLDLQNRAYGIHIAAITNTRSLTLPPPVIKDAIKRMMTSIAF